MSTRGLVFVWLAGLVVGGSALGVEEPVAPRPRLAFVGLHGGVFDELKRFAPTLALDVEFIDDERIAREEVDFRSYRAVFLQHVREEDRAQLVRLLSESKGARPDQRIVSISEIRGGALADLARTNVVEYDPELERYYGTSPENLRRLLAYVAIKYLGQPGDVPAPTAEAGPRGLFHPDARGTFSTTDEFLAWMRGLGRQVNDGPRAVVAVHATHLAFQQPRVVEALVREFERQGVLAVGMVDTDASYPKELRRFAPQVVVHVCHGMETASTWEEWSVPHLQCIFIRQQSIDQWRPSNQGLAPSEAAFQVVGQELLGGIEPQVGAGTVGGGGSPEAFTPIPERVEHLVGRAVAWIKLATLANADKRVAVIYYDRELGKSELMRGSATGMFMNGPRSLVGVLRRMKQAGYALADLPADEHALLRAMADRGRQIGLWAPAELDRLARSGNAVLVPLEQYDQWFRTKIPPAQQAAVRATWGPSPGQFLTWERDGKQFIVIPRIDLGNVILLPQPLRGEAHDASRLHDKLVPPPHNYLATYFWLQEEFKASALIHFGTHGSEFLLPGKPVGLSNYDWPDILLGRMPNINPWVINNLGESSEARRRSYAVLIDHLTPPSVDAALADELLNLHNDIDRWAMLDHGALKDKFAQSITAQVLSEHLDRELKLTPANGLALSPAQIEQVLAYLHELRNETIPVSLHVLGQPPRDDLLIPYLVTCLRKDFLEALAHAVDVPSGEKVAPGGRQTFLRRKAEELLELTVRRQYSPQEALAAVTGVPFDQALSKELHEGFLLAERLAQGFAHTHREIDNLLLALDGRYVPPGPGGGPDRNPGVVPTGRNMFLLNPEEVPSRPSWELGTTLVDQLLAHHLKQKGRYPERVGFTLDAFATFQDFGVMESQILYLLGVRPVWDEQNLVVDVELIPTAELRRPRIDVFLASFSYYRDLLPTRMRLIDKAARMVGALEEEQNPVYRNSRRIARELADRGVPPDEAQKLARARIFGYPPGQNGSASYYYLVERSGEWDDREGLVRAYLEHVRYVYTDGMWGKEAPAAYERQIQGTEVVVRSWADRTTSPLSNKYTWFHGGSLCMAVKYLTGKEPEYLLADVRDSQDARLLTAEEALQRDFRARLFNRKWIEGMMKEGYAGADQIAVHVSNALGWTITRPGSVSPEQWEEVVDIYVRDSKQLALREWIEAENPFAFQDMTEVLLESIRKGYWQPSSETLAEIAREYASSVSRHGEGGGLRGGGNVKLEELVRRTLGAPGDAALLAAYQRALESTVAVRAPDVVAAQATTTAAGSLETVAPGRSPPTTDQNREAPVESQEVAGTRLEPAEPSQRWGSWLIPCGLAVLLLALIGLGAWRRVGAS